MNRAVCRECDPEESDRDEDTTDLTHDEPEFRSDGTVFLELFKCKPVKTRQSRRIEELVCLIPVPKWLRQPSKNHANTNSQETQPNEPFTEPMASEDDWERLEGEVEDTKNQGGPERKSL